MKHPSLNAKTIAQDLKIMGISSGDGVFVHAATGAIGHVTGGAHSVVDALLSTVGPRGLIGMPAFCADACFPSQADRAEVSDVDIKDIKRSVSGFDLLRSSAAGMGIIAKTFRTWPGAIRRWGICWIAPA